MEADNPYQAPDANLETSPAFGQYDQSSVFSPKGRFGRLSYLAWAFGINMIFGMLLGMILGFTGQAAGLSPETHNVLGLVIQLPLLVVGVIFGIRRLHDIDMSGWWLLLAIVPLVNVIFGLFMVFKGGAEDANRFGPPRFTPGWEKVVGAVLPGLVFVGILAAIAIPAYNGYVQAAMQANGG